MACCIDAAQADARRRCPNERRCSDWNRCDRRYTCACREDGARRTRRNEAEADVGASARSTHRCAVAADERRHVGVRDRALQTCATTTHSSSGHRIAFAVAEHVSFAIHAGTRQRWTVGCLALALAASAALTKLDYLLLVVGHQLQVVRVEEVGRFAYHRGGKSGKRQLQHRCTGAAAR